MLVRVIFVFHGRISNTSNTVVIRWTYLSASVSTSSSGSIGLTVILIDPTPPGDPRIWNADILKPSTLVLAATVAGELYIIPVPPMLVPYFAPRNPRIPSRRHTRLLLRPPTRRHLPHLEDPKPTRVCRPPAIPILIGTSHHVLFVPDEVLPAPVVDGVDARLPLGHSTTE